MKRLFGHLNNEPIFEYTIFNQNNHRISVLSYGGVIRKWMAPDRDGNVSNIVLGFETMDEYVASSPYFGAIIGRHAGRIDGGAFRIGDKTYDLATNDGANHLHGGERGFDRHIWQVEEDVQRLTLTRTSAHMEEGYPGELDVRVTYELTDDNELVITYEATTTEPTVCNLTNHTYFQIGQIGETVASQALTIAADAFAPIRDDSIPTGERIPVEGTLFDFRSGRTLGTGFHRLDEQLEHAQGGYDHPFFLNGTAGPQATLVDESSGRRLTVTTDLPVLVVYSGNQLDGSIAVEEGIIPQYGAICLEAQHLPNEINDVTTSGTLLSPGETYRATTTYQVTTD
ncbi:aldose epimerase family protein [Exiguobacterium alkaliphilum]|uniref:aldose epimerase family protein n=1 Tax=Exiguobacterium alkaliphilum TaxID=1428684 RepID=UPI0034648076